MEIRVASIDDYEPIKNIVKTTINGIYPDYYPQGAVEFFLHYHNDNSILKALKEETVLILIDEGKIVGTGSFQGNSVKRFFVLPEYQGRGYGTFIMDEIEKRIFVNHDEIILEASLPAYGLYCKRGYQSTELSKIRTRNGHMLCYHTMKKVKKETEC